MKFTRAHVLCLAQLLSNDELLILNVFRLLLFAYGIRDSKPSLLSICTQVHARCTEQEAAYARKSWRKFPEDPHHACLRLCRILLDGKYPEVQTLDDFEGKLAVFLKNHHGKHESHTISINAPDGPTEPSVMDPELPGSSIPVPDGPIPVVTDPLIPATLEPYMSYCLQCLSREEGIIFYLRAIGGAEWNEIVERTGIPMATAKRRFASAVKKLRDQFGG